LFPKLKGIELYKLIQTLTPARKRNLKLYGNLYQRKGAWKVLFDRLNAANEYDGEEIRGEKFKSAKAFSTAKRKIMDILVASIAHFEYNNQRTHIEIACDLEMRDYATKLLEKSILSAEKEENLEALHRLYQIARDLEYDPAYQFTLPKVDLSESVLVEEIATSHQLQQQLRRLRLAFRQGARDRQFTSRSVEDQIRESQPQTKRVAFLRQKTLAACAALREDIELSIQLHQNIIQGVQNGSLRANPRELMGEHAVLVLSLLGIDEYEQAHKQILKMGLVKPESPRDRRLFDTHFLLTSMELAEHTYNLPLLEMGLERLDKWKDLIRPAIHVNRRLIAAKVFFVHGQYSQCLRQLRKVEQLNFSLWKQYAWLVRALELVVIWEQKDMDRFDYALQRSRRWSIENKLAYPKRFTKLLGDLGNAVSSQETQVLLSQSLEDIQQLNFTDSEAKVQIDTFDFRIWVKSKLLAKSMSDLVELDKSKQRELTSKIV